MNSAEPRIPDRRPGFLGPFRFKDFRLLWSGLLVSNLGTWMQFTALGYYVAALAPNEAVGALDIGLLGAARAVPVLLLSPFAGVVADRYPRRLVLFVTNGLTSVLSFVLFALVATNHAPLWTLMITSGLQAATQAFDAPARQSWVPLMVPREYVGGAIGLNSVAFNAPSVVGPPLAGLLIAGVGVAQCFLVNGLTTLAVLAALVFMQPAPPSSTRRGNVIGAIVEGVRFIAGHPVLQLGRAAAGRDVADVAAVQLFAPGVCRARRAHRCEGAGLADGRRRRGRDLRRVLHRGDRQRTPRHDLDRLVAPRGAGRRRARPHRARRARRGCSWGSSAWRRMSFIGSSNIMLQTLSPDDMRGRAISVYSMILLGLVPSGSLIMGALATLLQLRWTFVLAGAVAALFALWIALTQPQVREV